jgi:hypothetical protein
MKSGRLVKEKPLLELNMKPNLIANALSIKDTAVELGVSQRHVMQLISEHKLEGSFILGHMRFIPRTSVERRKALTTKDSSNDSAK